MRRTGNRAISHRLRDRQTALKKLTEAPAQEEREKERKRRFPLRKEEKETILRTAAVP